MFELQKLFKPKKKSEKYCCKQCQTEHYKNSGYISTKGKANYLKNKEYIQQKHREYYLAHKEEARERGRKNRAIRRATDPLYRLVQLTRSSVRDALKSYKVKKNFRTFETLGYNVQELYEHLEVQFEKQSLPEREPITCDNQGAIWAVDHIKPIASFKLINDDGTINKEQFKEYWALKNLQPLYNDLNSTKSSWYAGQYHRMGKAIKETNTYKPKITSKYAHNVVKNL